MIKSGSYEYRAYRPDGKTRYKIAVGPKVKKSKISIGWTPAKNIPKSCTEMLLIAEDPGFFEHRGIELHAMRIALRENIERKQYKFGASTITQQLVKNLFLWREKSAFRKGIEVIGAVIFDFMVSKNDQLAWYLNVVEFGPNIYGIKHAAQDYFHKSVPELNPRDCLILIGSLTRPKKVHQLVQKNALDIHKYRTTRALLNIYQQRHPNQQHFFEKKLQ